ncbi:hypothetical protein B0T26DRAFT_694803 [Lasiosphaeria miniovina]|uniref:Uncharacterized protein n=1 Tax=Lasiosphaeria miniovina TaxID=1954250 RepID=A0AA40B519_9PEZI|nr:uncharacterized protein B0T26DRAFT_694803 [Lasiosphaeria miniovina]KAK0727508.1 hypothetical protein B0T26DRAFT_694803 [Lasiosphaeria miniovina]
MKGVTMGGRRQGSRQGTICLAGGYTGCADCVGLCNGRPGLGGKVCRAGPGNKDPC